MTEALTKRYLEDSEASMMAHFCRNNQHQEVANIYIKILLNKCCLGSKYVSVLGHNTMLFSNTSLRHKTVNIS